MLVELMTLARAADIRGGDELDVVCEEQMIACMFICQVIDEYQEVRKLGESVFSLILQTTNIPERSPP